MIIREYRQEDIEAMIRIWNEVIEEGIAFPYEDLLDTESGAELFASQSYTGVAEADGTIKGLYVLHPNNTGHCGHLYERLGFTQLGVIPGGFRMKDGHYENICPYYHVL